MSNFGETQLVAPVMCERIVTDSVFLDGVEFRPQDGCLFEFCKEFVHSLPAGSDRAAIVLDEDSPLLSCPSSTGQQKTRAAGGGAKHIVNVFTRMRRTYWCRAGLRAMHAALQSMHRREDPMESLEASQEFKIPERTLRRYKHKFYDFFDIYGEDGEPPEPWMRKVFAFDPRKI